MRSAWVSAVVGLLLLCQAAQGRADIYLSGHVGVTDTSSGLVDDRDSGAGVSAGWLVNEFVGMEIGYSDLGRLESGDATIDASAVRVAAVVRLPLAAWSLFARIGGADLRVERRSGGETVDDSSIETYGSVGVAYRFDRLALTLEWSQYNNADNDLQVLAAGLMWTF